MGVYGYDFYGSPTKYGATPLVEFDARPFQAIPIDYDAILLAWSTPTGAWDTMRLIRDPNGYTPRADMGEVLLEVPASGSPTSYIDISTLTPGNFYYYTIWVRATADGLWRRAADTTALAVKDWRYSGRLFELVPLIYREKDGDHETMSVYGAGPLERFLRIFGFQLDHIRSEYESLKQVSNPDRVSGGLLPLMTRQYGFGFEQELGMRLARMQARNAVHIYKLKGTRLGVEAVASVLTGWAPTVSTGANLVLDQNEASFAESLGRWGVDSGIGLVARIDAVAAGLGQAVPIPTGASTGDIGSGIYAMRVAPGVAGDIHLALIPSWVSADLWRQSLIPVAPATSHTFSVYVRSTVVRGIQLGIQEFNAIGVSGNFIEAAAVNSTTGGWTRLTYTLTVDATTRFVRLFIKVVGAGTSEYHYFQAVQVEVGAAATAFQDARQTRIRFHPERINHIPNPSFEVDTFGWEAVTNCTIARSTAQAASGAASLAVTAIAAGNAQPTTPGSTPFPVVPGTSWTASASWLAGATSRSIGISINWFTAGMANYLGTTFGASEVSDITMWKRVFVSGVVPPTAAFATVVPRFTAGVAGETHYVDDVLFEEGAALRDYFDGQSVSGEGEYIWEGTPAASRTLYYSRRLIKNFRMNQRIRDFLPAGSTYKLLYSAT